MKVGDLVRPIQPPKYYDGISLAPEDWKGIIVGFKEGDVVVFWNEDYPEEWECPEELEVISESR